MFQHIVIYYIASFHNCIFKNKKILSLLLYLVSFVSCLYHLNNQFWYLDVFISILHFIWIFLFGKQKNKLLSIQH